MSKLRWLKAVILTDIRKQSWIDFFIICALAALIWKNDSTLHQHKDVLNGHTKALNIITKIICKECSKESEKDAD